MMLAIKRESGAGVPSLGQERGHGDARLPGDTPSKAGRCPRVGCGQRVLWNGRG